LDNELEKIFQGLKGQERKIMIEKKRERKIKEL